MNRYLFYNKEDKKVSYIETINWVEKVIDSTVTKKQLESCENLIDNFINNLLFYTMDYTLYKSTENKLRKLLQKKSTTI